MSVRKTSDSARIQPGHKPSGHHAAPAAHGQSAAPSQARLKGDHAAPMSQLPPKPTLSQLVSQASERLGAEMAQVMNSSQWHALRSAEQVRNFGTQLTQDIHKAKGYLKELDANQNWTVESFEALSKEDKAKAQFIKNVIDRVNAEELKQVFGRD